MKIVFTNAFKDFDIEKPVPAINLIPDWYKQLESYVGGSKKPNGEGGSSGTIKKCVPVFDAITAGYIIKTPVDVFISRKNGEPFFEWAGLNIIGFHPIEQAPTHPQANGMTYLKWINPWSIKTPKGYSVLFTQPKHRDSVFTIMDGIVDTDNYFGQVNFPFVLNDPSFEGLIPAGTPMAQVIPFKRTEWKLEIGGEKERKESYLTINKLNMTFFNRYKNLFWQRKTFK